MSLYLAHAARDTSWADIIRRHIGNAHDVAPQLDARGEPSTDSGLINAQRLVVLLTAAYVTSGMSEVGWWLAHRQGDPVTVFLLDSSPLPSTLEGHEYVDWFNLNGLSNDVVRGVVSSAVARSKARPKVDARDTSTARRKASLEPPGRGVVIERPGLVDELRRRLLKHSHVTLAGPRGVGKTTLVLEYINRHSDIGEFVGWIDAETESEVMQRLVAFAVVAGLCEPNATPVDARRALTRKHGRRLLLVLDDARSEDVLQWLPGRMTRTIITSEHEWPGIADLMSVPPLTDSESTALLRRLLPSLSRRAAQRLARECSGMPDRLVRGVEAVRTARMPVDELLPDEHEPAGATAHAIAPPTSAVAPVMNQFTGDDSAALQLIRICAVMNPAPVPLKLLRVDATSRLPAPLATTAIHPQRLADCLADIMDMRIGTLTPSALAKELRPQAVRAEEGELPVDDRPGVRSRIAQQYWPFPPDAAFELERSARATVLTRMTEQQRAAAERCARELLMAADPGSNNDRARWDAWRELEPLVLPPEQVPDDPAFHAFVNAAFASRLERAGARVVRAELEAFRVAAEKDHPHRLETTGTVRNLAACYRGLGRFRDAKELDEPLWGKRRRAADVDKRLKFESMIDFVLDLCGDDQLEEAYKLADQAERNRLDYDILSQTDPLWLRLVQTKGIIVYKQKHFSEALTFHRFVLENRGPRDHGHPFFQTSRTYVARCLLRLGDEAEAVRILETVAGELRNLLEPGHPEIEAADRDLAAARRALNVALLHDAAPRKITVAASGSAIPARTVAVAATRWSPGTESDAFNRRLCTALAAEGHMVLCFANSITASDLASARTSGVSLFPFPSSDAKESGLPAPDIVIGYGEATGMAALALMGLYPSARRAHIVHTPPSASTRDAQFTSFQLAASADAVIAVGRTVHSSWRSALGSDATVVLLNPGFSSARTKSEDARILPRRVSFFADAGGTEQDNRGLELAVKALAEVVRLRPDVKLELVLHNVQSQATDVRERIAEWTRDARLTITIPPHPPDPGWLDEELRSTGLVLMPQRLGEFGLVGLEAIENGLPLLLSTRSGLAELLNELTDAPSAARTLVRVDDDGSDLLRWTVAVVDALNDPLSTMRNAINLRSELARARSWDQTARDFVSSW